VSRLDVRGMADWRDVPGPVEVCDFRGRGPGGVWAAAAAAVGGVAVLDAATRLPGGRHGGAARDPGAAPDQARHQARRISLPRRLDRCGPVLLALERLHRHLLATPDRWAAPRGGQRGADRPVRVVPLL